MPIEIGRSKLFLHYTPAVPIRNFLYCCQHYLLIVTAHRIYRFRSWSDIRERMNTYPRKSAESSTVVS
jgi:hypothetical protein